ncbi:ornithine cyclodeaminase family protein [Marivita sp. S0852]|uniref:ornithine cyclodeaminase family protein n=1 Tax=Marivita sp. S0852 TaxID=3373893 RepID=UPI00398258B5
MIYVTEDQSSALVTPKLAFDAARAAFVAALDEDARVFPVVNAHACDPQNRFSIKSAAGSGLAGLKVGAYFPTNDARGVPRHASTIVLIDQATGKIGALIEGSALNCYRTAAADAVATDALARKDASVLAVFGTGHQAAYEAQAIARIRPVSRIMVVGRDATRSATLVAKLHDMGLPADAAQPEDATRAADIIVTVTTADTPLFQADWVQPGTHISSMGSDAKGKQELPPDLFPNATLFCDLPAQSVTIGEFQHATNNPQIIAIGQVLTGTTEGRRSDTEITIFDSSGISLQDLFIGQSILNAVTT